jgi:hypothetical protein
MLVKSPRQQHFPQVTAAVANIFAENLSHLPCANCYSESRSRNLGVYPSARRLIVRFPFWTKTSTHLTAATSRKNRVVLE